MKIRCWKCRKEIKEKNYAFTQFVLGDRNNPAAANKPDPIHAKCLRKDLDESAYTTEEKEQALKVLAELNQ